MILGQLTMGARQAKNAPLTYTIISLAIMWLIAIMNMTMMIMKSMRKIIIRSITFVIIGESRLDPDSPGPAETEKAQLSGQLPHP